MQTSDSRNGRMVSLPEASRILNLPETTIRNLVRAGKLEGGQVLRSPDNPNDKRYVWRILITDPQTEDVPSESEHPQPSSSWLQDRLVERDETIAGLYVELGELRERVGRAEALAASVTALQAELDRLRARPWWRAWWAW